MHVTPNSQHLSVAVTRYRWEIDSFRRNAAICAKLAKDPNNIYLQPFEKTCAALQSYTLGFNFFGQYASSCFPFTYCPHINSVIVDRLDDGLYLPRPHFKAECPRGSFCQQGNRFDVCIKFFFVFCNFFCLLT